MRKIIFLFLSSLFLVLTSCNDDLVTPIEGVSEGNDGIDLELRDPPNYTAMEDSLNKFYVDSPRIVVRPNVTAFPFTHSNGYISSTEMTEIKDSIDNIIADEDRNPQIVDISILEDSVYVIFDDKDSNIPNFPGDLRPNGGIIWDGSYKIGHWCDDTEDSKGGGCGRVARAFLGSFSQSVNVLYYKDIRRYGIIGACSDSEFDDWDNGYLEASEVDIWHYKTSNCTNIHDHCLSSTEMDDQYDAAHTAVNDHLPSTHQIIGAYSIKYDLIGSPATSEWWYYYLLAGTPVYSGS